MTMTFLPGAPVRLSAEALEALARRSSTRLRETLEALEARRDAARTEEAWAALDRAVRRLETALMRVDLQIAESRARRPPEVDPEIEVEFDLMRLMLRSPEAAIGPA